MSPAVSNPIFRKNGFELSFLGPNFRVPPQVRVAGARHKPPIDIGDSPKPDLLLHSTTRSHWIPLECKVHSFSPASTTCSQAYGLLACSGPDIAVNYGLSNPSQWKSTVIYAVSYPDHSKMQTTLDKLTTTLRNANVPVGKEPSTAVGIAVQDDGIYLHFSDLYKVPFDVDATVKVVESLPGNDPRPLYLICVDPTSSLNYSPRRHGGTERAAKGSTSLVGRQAGRPAVRHNLRASVSPWCNGCS